MTYDAFRRPFSPVNEFWCRLFASKLEENKRKGGGMEKRQKVAVQAHDSVPLKILSALKEGMLHFLLPCELRVVNFRSEWQPCQMATLTDSMPYSCVWSTFSIWCRFCREGGIFRSSRLYGVRYIKKGREGKWIQFPPFTLLQKMLHATKEKKKYKTS